MSNDRIPAKPELSTGPIGEGLKRRDFLLSGSSLVAASALSAVGLTSPAKAQQPATAPAAAGQRPNIVVIMGDDIGIWNIGAYHRGMMAGRTPNLDKIAAEGMLFTDYYAEASCTAGRANFITGELPIRTGMTTVGQAGAPTGLPAEAVTIATALKGMGYATGQFGKNHLGDKNEFLPTVHGFDEFFGYLYHLDAMEDPAHPGYPQELLNTVGPRNMIHSWATNMDDATVDPRWGKIGKQRIEDAGTLYPKRMQTVDDEIRDAAIKFIEKAKAENKPFFLWLNPTRMHIVTHLSEKYQKIAQCEERLVHPRSWHGAARRRHRDRDAEVEGHGRRREHHRHLHDRQRHRSLHMAGRRANTVRTKQGHSHGGWLPSPGDDPLARQGSGRQGRKRTDLRARLVPDTFSRCWQSEHRQRTEERKTDRGPHLQVSPGRLQPDGHDYRQGSVQSA